MRKFAQISLGTLLGAIIFSSNAYAGNPWQTQGLNQELAGTIGQNQVSVDLYNTSDFRSMVRIGLPTDGELLYDMDDDLVGYKHLFSKNVAAYGMFAYDSDDDGSDKVAGIAYSGQMEQFQYNINAEMFFPGNGGDDTTTVSAGIYYGTSAQFLGKFQLIGEYSFDTTEETSQMYGALRFRPNRNFVADIGVYQSDDDDTDFGLPVFFRVTLKL